MLAEAPATMADQGRALLAAGDSVAASRVLRLARAGGDRQPATLLNLALAIEAAGDPQRGRAMMRDVAAEIPDWDEPHLRLAISHRAANDHAAAVAAYTRALELEPTRAESLLGLAAMRMQEGAAAEAQLLLLRCCGLHPAHPEAWDALGLSLLLAGDAAAAEAAYAEAQRLSPGDLSIALHRAEAAHVAGSTEQELARLDAVLVGDPFAHPCLAAAGLLLQRAGRLAEAADRLEAAFALAPDSARIAALLGHVQAALLRPREAEPALRAAIALEAGDPGLENDLAAVLMRLDRHAEAHALLASLLARHGKAAIVLGNLATAAVTLGRQDEAVACARDAVALAPRSETAWRALCNTVPYCDSVQATALLDDLRGFAAVLPRPATPPSFPNQPEPDRKLRIGLLSCTLRTHPVGWLTVAGFEALDPAEFDLVCLAQPAGEDPMARRFRARSFSWHDITGLDDAALGRLGRAEAIDLLIDLGGYGEAGRMTACAQRLAPVQAKWVGTQNHSTGLPEIDWFLTDRWETPEGFERFYSERLLRLPDGYVCYSPPAHAPEVGPSPAQANGFVTFGCFNSLAKVTPRVIATWAEILRHVPRSRFILKAQQLADPGTAERMRAAFAGYGVSPDQLILRGGSPHRVLLAEYGLVDVVLDPFPYSGGLTTCEALWMGVPTLTMPGETFASRHSASHMSNVGLADWVVEDRDAYVAAAIERAAGLDELAALRAGLRARVKSSPLCDAPRFGRGLGAALRHAWRHWCVAQREQR